MSLQEIGTGSRILVLALLGVASAAPPAAAKVVWNQPELLSIHGGVLCQASPLDRAEGLAWRQNFIIRRPGYPIVPPPVAPFGLWVPFTPYVQTGWFWASPSLGRFAPFCDR